MSLSFDLVRAAVVVLLGMGLVRLFLGRRSAAVRHQAYRVLLVLAFLTPIVGSVLSLYGGVPVATLPAATVRDAPRWVPESVLPPGEYGLRRPSRNYEEVEHVREMRAIPILAAIQIVGMLLFALPACLAWRRLQRIERSATRGEPFRGVAVLHATDRSLTVPIVYGHPAKIMLPRAADDWPEARVKAALLHEWAHVRRGDWTWGHMARSLAWMNWANPTIHLLARALRTTAEQAADDEVLSEGLLPSVYARELLAVAAQPSHFDATALAMVGRGGLGSRIHAVLAKDRDRSRSSLAFGASAAFLFGLVTVGISGATTRLHSYTIPSPPGAVLASDSVADVGDNQWIFRAIEEKKGNRVRTWSPDGYPTSLPKDEPAPPGRSSDGLTIYVDPLRPFEKGDSIRVRFPARDGVATSTTLSGMGRFWTYLPRDDRPLTTTFQVGIADGPWTTRRLAWNGVGTLDIPAALFDFEECAFTVLTRDGARHTAREGGVGHVGDVRSLFLAPPDADANGQPWPGAVAVEVRHRPFRWAVFPDVRLQPNGDVAWRAAR